MNLRQARRELFRLIKAGNAVILKSKSGMGKSQMILQVFRKFQADRPTLSVRFGVIFAATQTPSDLIGFQFKGQRSFPHATLTEAGETGTVMRAITVTD